MPSTRRTTHEVSTVGVKLSSTIVSLDVDLSLIDETDDLDVVGGLGELDTGEGTSRDEAGAVTLLRAPGDLLTLGVTDGGVGVRGCPKTEVVEVVDHGGLTHGLRALGRGVAAVVALLGSTNAVVGIGLVRLETGRVKRMELLPVRRDLQGCCNRSAWMQGG